MPQNLRRAAPAGLPEIPYDRLAEYYTRLGKLNVGPEDAIFPLGSCTMKYNPYINEWAAGLPGFSQLHPQAPLKDAQGSLEIIYETQEWFKKITGLPGVTTQPVAGAQGELTGIKMFQAYHRSRGETQRDTILIPKSAHGTNFATAIMAGYPTKKVAGRTAGIALLDNDETGQIDMEQLDRVLAEHQGHVAGIMVTNPNTGGLFETRFKEVAERIHAAGGLVYMDGANMNAIAGRIDLNAMGVDAVHNNTHKTWTIPHGGGGPGDAFVGVSEPLLDFMPGMQVIKHADGTLEPVRPRHSIGSLHRHWGQFAHKVRCYTYLRRLGNDGIPRMSAMAVLAARYLYERLKDITPVLPKGAGDQPRMHEFILTVSNEDFEKFEAAGIPKAQVMPSIGKLFLDFGYHAPTVAFPEPFGLMIEPTESFTKAELDRFADATEAILGLVRKHPEVLKTAPHFTPINRVDEVGANRALTLFETLEDLPELPSDRTASQELLGMEIPDICEKILIESPKQTPAF
jgi:glycine dehydrogenase